MHAFLSLFFFVLVGVGGGEVGRGRDRVLVCVSPVITYQRQILPALGLLESDRNLKWGCHHQRRMPLKYLGPLITLSFASQTLHAQGQPGQGTVGTPQNRAPLFRLISVLLSQ